MKGALSIVARILELAESNPALLVVIATLSVPLALVCSGWIARLAIRHWRVECPDHC